MARGRKQLGMAVDAEANPGGKTFGAFDKRGKARKWILIGHFRVPKNLTFKTRLSAKPLL